MNISVIEGVSLGNKDYSRENLYKCIDHLKRSNPGKKINAKIMLTSEQWEEIVEWSFAINMDHRFEKEYSKKHGLDDGPVTLFGHRVISINSDKFYIFIEKEIN